MIYWYDGFENDKRKHFNPHNVINKELSKGPSFSVNTGPSEVIQPINITG